MLLLDCNDYFLQDCNMWVINFNLKRAFIFKCEIIYASLKQASALNCKWWRWRETRQVTLRCIFDGTLLLFLYCLSILTWKFELNVLKRPRQTIIIKIIVGLQLLINWVKNYPEICFCISQIQSTDCVEQIRCRFHHLSISASEVTKVPRQTFRNLSWFCCRRMPDNWKGKNL